MGPFCRIANRTGAAGVSGTNVPGRTPIGMASLVVPLTPDA
jgi:hypothetical protein